MTNYSAYCGMSRSDLVREHHMLATEVQTLKDKYQRDVFGVNNEGDPIGGDPAGGYANDVARLKEENESLRKDAERYRFLRDDCYLAHVQVMQIDGSQPYVYSDELDRSIDEIICSPENP